MSLPVSVYLIAFVASGWIAGFIVGGLKSKRARQFVGAALFLVPSISVIAWGAFGQTGMLVQTSHGFGMAFWLFTPVVVLWIFFAAAGLMTGLKKQDSSS